MSFFCKKLCTVHSDLEELKKTGNLKHVRENNVWELKTLWCICGVTQIVKIFQLHSMRYESVNHDAVVDRWASVTTKKCIIDVLTCHTNPTNFGIVIPDHSVTSLNHCFLCASCWSQHYIFLVQGVEWPKYFTLQLFSRTRSALLWSARSSKILLGSFFIYMELLLTIGRRSLRNLYTLDSIHSVVFVSEP